MSCSISLTSPRWLVIRIVAVLIQAAWLWMATSCGESSAAETISKKSVLPPKGKEPSSQSDADHDPSDEDRPTIKILSHDPRTVTGANEGETSSAIAHRVGPQSSLPETQSDEVDDPHGDSAKDIEKKQSPIKISIQLTNLQPGRGGLVCIAVYTSPETFLTDRFTLSHCKSPNQNIIVMLLPTPGEYAFTVLHDADNNERLSRNFFGIPKEGFGFSNNPRILFGPPKFESVSTFIGNASDILIKMRYF